MRTAVHPWVRAMLMGVAMCAAALVLAGSMSVPTAFAENPTGPGAPGGLLEGALVPSCSSAQNAGEFFGFAGACQLCDFAKLADNVIRFAVAFTVVVATVMFAYAGFLYVSGAASEGNIKKAHSIFTKVFVGLIVVLISWLIIHMLLSVLTGGGLNVWGEIGCGQYQKGGTLTQYGGVFRVPVTPGSSTGTGTGGGGGLPYDAGAEDQMRRQLQGKIDINNPPCLTPQASGCTNVGGLQQIVVDRMVMLENRCNCQVTITGGTEQGPHQGHTGRQVDVRDSDAVRQYLSDPTHRTEMGITHYIDEGDHLHLEF